MPRVWPVKPPPFAMSENSVLEALTASVVPEVLHDPLTVPVAAPEENVPVKVPHVTPDRLPVTVQLDEARVQLPAGLREVDARLPASATEQLGPPVGETAAVPLRESVSPTRNRLSTPGGSTFSRFRDLKFRLETGRLQVIYRFLPRPIPPFDAVC